MEQNIVLNTALYPHIKYEIEVLPELEFFIRKQTKSEYQLLKNSIKTHGCKEPLKLWKHGGVNVLVDGHHRLHSCYALDMDFSFEFLFFNSIEEVKMYMAKNQLGRRNLKTQEVSYLRGMQYDFVKKGVGESNEKEGNTRDILAKEYGVSSATISRDFITYQALEKLPLEEKQDYLQGTSFLQKKDIDFIGKHDVDVKLVLSFLKNGLSLEDVILHYFPTQVITKKTKIDRLSFQLEKEIKEATFSQKQIYKKQLLALIQLIDE